MPTTKAQSLRRLRRLREVMASARKTKHGYVMRVGKKRLLFDISTWHASTSCGTAACVVGIAACLPMFKRLGLTWVGDKAIAIDGEVVTNGAGALFHDAFGAMLGIAEDSAEDLVRGSGYDAFDVTPKHVVTKLDALIAEVEKR